MKQPRSQLTRALFVLMLFAGAMTASAYDFEVDGIFYNVNSSDPTTASVTFKGATYSETKSYRGDIVVPGSVTHDGITYQVTTIGEQAFRGCDSIYTVVLSSPIKEIKSSAFYQCTSLTSINLPKTLTSIGYSAFSYNTSLRHVDLPGSVTTLGSSVFSYSGIESIFIPRNVTNISGNLCLSCDSLTSIVVDSENTTYYSDNCNAVIQKSNNTLIMGCATTVIPETVVTIGSSAFNRCSGLTSITIPDAVKKIENSAFNRCINLTELHISPSSQLYEIGDYAFENCSRLTSLFIPKTTRYIDSYTITASFKGCSGLTSIVVDPDNPYFDSRDNCNAIINSENGRLIIGSNNAFIPDGVKTISPYAFYKCVGLTKIHIPDGLTFIGYLAFYGCSGITELTFGNSVKEIDTEAFSGCSGITSLKLPNTLIKLGDYAFGNCSALNDLAFGKSLKTIDDYAFYGCSALTEVVIPKNVTYVGRGAFSYMPHLTSVTCLAMNPPVASLNPTTVFGSYSIATLYVHESVVEAYQQAIPWRLFSNIVGIIPKFEEDGITYELVGGKSVNVTCNDVSDYSGTLNIPETVLHEGRTYDIVGIGENAFNGDTQLEHVVLPGTIYSIDYAAFQGCSSLKTINFEQGLDSIASLAFDGCDALETIICKPLVPPIMVSKNCFTMTAYDNATLRVPNESIRLYHESERWSEFYNIVRMESIEQGDANGDFKVDVSDITALIDYITGASTDSINSMLMDLNYDGDVTIADVTILIDTVLNSNN